MTHKNYECPKCDNKEFEVGEFRATSGTFARLFDVQNAKFTTVTCTRCHYTDIYRTPKSTLSDVMDFMVGG